MQFLDLELARRLEAASASSGRSCAEAGRKRHPEFPYAVEDIAGGAAVFGGVDSPITQAMGVGLQGDVAQEEIARLEDFFHSRGAASAVELCPLAGIPLYEIFAAREYRLLEVTNVLVRELTGSDRPFTPPGVDVHPATPGDAELFTSITLAGWASAAPVTASMSNAVGDFFHAQNSQAFIAFVDGMPAGGATACKHEGVAGMFGASTLPAFRQQGVQTALLAARLAWAVDQGCGLAKGITLPGSSSQRNHERFGFRVAYTRTKLVRNLAPSG